MSKWEKVPEKYDFHCRKCDSTEIEFYCWESSDGAYEDYHYRCLSCKKDWWVESSDY